MIGTREAAAQLGDAVAADVVRLARGSEQERQQAAQALLGALDYALATCTPLSAAVRALDRHTRNPGRTERTMAVLQAHALLVRVESASEAATADRLDRWPEHGEVEPPELQQLLVRAYEAGADFPVSGRTVQSILAAHRALPDNSNARGG